MEQKAKTLIIDSIPTLKMLAEKFSSYQVAKIDLFKIVYFLSQFKDYDKIKIIIKLLESINFIDSSRMTYLLRKAYDEIPEELTQKPLISSLGSIQDSSAVVCYQLLKQLFNDENSTLDLISDVNSIGTNIENNLPTSIIFFDDNITSGTQLSSFFEELIEGKSDAEQVKNPLNESQYKLLKKIPIRICYAVQLAQGSNNIIEKIRKKYEIDIHIHSGKIDFNNYLDYQCDTMENQDEAKFSRTFIREISTSLFEDKEWNDNTVYDRLLGYGNLGKLTVFYYNIPKSLIPIFWKSGKYDGNQWIPLFPETQQQKLIIKNSIDYNYYHKETIENWINTGNKQRRPNLLFGFKGNNGITSEIELQIPTIESIKNYFGNGFFPKKAEYQENKLDSGRNVDLTQLLSNIYPTLALSDNDYNRYKKEVDIYNKDLSNFYDLIQENIFQEASNTNVTFQIANNGNIKATDCTVKLFYNTGDILLNGFYRLPKPTFEKDYPILNDFDTSHNYARVTMQRPHYDLINLNVKKSEPIKKDTDYEYKIFSNCQISHNDNENKEVIITRMNFERNDFKIFYQINFHEEAETLEGFIKVKFTETDNINEKIKKELYDSFKELKKIR